MMRTQVPFIGPSFAYPGLPLGVQSSINYYLDLIGNEGRSSSALRGCPGLVPEVTGLNGAIRGLFEANDAGYVVAGTKLYKIDSVFGTTELGTIPGTDPVYIIEGTTYILICDRPIGYLKGYALIPNNVTFGYTYNKTTAAFAQVTDADFNSTTTTAQFFISALEDFTTYDALDFDSANIKPDDLLGIFVVGTQALMVGKRSIEFWYYSGAADFPFAQQDGMTLNKGVKSYKSVSVGDDTIFFLGEDLSFYTLIGSRQLRISNSVIEEIVSRETNISQTEAFYHYWQGHKFYCVILPSGRSLIFDHLLVENPNIAWHERKTWNKSRWRANSACYLNNKVIVGDYAQGRLYSLSGTTYTDDGEILEATRIGNFMHADNRKMKIPDFQITAYNGQGLVTSPDVDPLISLSISRDGGRTFSQERTRSLGKNGEYEKIIRWRNNGQTRTSMAFKTTITADCPRDIINATGDVEVGY